MAQLARRDFGRMLDFLHGLYATRTIDSYVACALQGLSQLVPGDVCVYNEVNPPRRRVKFVVEPADREPPDAPQIWAVHMHDHPMIEYWHGAKNNSLRQVVTLSDVISQREWHDRGLYIEFYRPIRMEHIIKLDLCAPGPLEISLTSLRGETDFGERDRSIFDLLRPHLVAGHENAEATTERERELTLLRAGMEAAGRAVIMLGEDRRIRQMTPRAQAWLIAYFGPRWTDRTRLPSPLDGWVKRQELGTASAGEAAPARRPLVAERDGRRLTLRLLSEGSRSLLLLTEEKLYLEPSDLAALGLARRETEVLTWVAAGKTNLAIAEILGLSPVTVKHCLERIYVKLGVGTRAAAAAIAMRAAGRTH